MAAAQWSHQGQKSHEQSISNQGPYTEEEIESLAEYSVSILIIHNKYQGTMRGKEINIVDNLIYLRYCI